MKRSLEACRNLTESHPGLLPYLAVISTLTLIGELLLYLTR